MELRETEKPKLEKHIKELKNSMHNRLPYDNLCYYLFKRSKNTFYYFVENYSLLEVYFHLGEHPYKIMTTGGIVKGRNYYVVTIQDYTKKRTVEKDKITISFGGIMENGLSLEENMLKELKEELGIEKNKIRKKRVLGVGENKASLSFLHLIEVDMDKEELKRSVENAKDSWEIKELIFVRDLNDLDDNNITRLLKKAKELGIKNES